MFCFCKSLLVANKLTKNSSHGRLTCGVPQGSILGPFIFLLYVNDMSQVVDCDRLLYRDYTGPTLIGAAKQSIEESLQRNFSILFMIRSRKTNWASMFGKIKLNQFFSRTPFSKILKNERKILMNTTNNKISQHICFQCSFSLVPVYCL